MKAFNWLLVLPTICLGFVILTSLVIFLVVRFGKRVINNTFNEDAPVEAGFENNNGVDSRWARADLAGKEQQEIIIELAACPACGGENPKNSSVCAFCGRKL